MQKLMENEKLLDCTILMKEISEIGELKTLCTMKKSAITMRLRKEFCPELESELKMV